MSAASPELFSAIQSRLKQGKRLRRNVPGDGRLKIDRPLPFLCLYRYPPDHDDLGTVELVTTEAAYLFASGQEQHVGELSQICTLVRDFSLERFGAFLLVEVWAEDLTDAAGSSIVHPTFQVVISPRKTAPELAETFCAALGEMTIDQRKATAEVVEADDIRPASLPALLPECHDDPRCHQLGVRVHPIYRDPTERTLYPLVLRELREQFAVALRKLFFKFLATETKEKSAHYQALGPTCFVQAAHLVDQQLCDIAHSFDYLLQITPTNSDDAWRQFREAEYRDEPLLHYRPLPRNPADLKRSLFELPIDRIEDASLAELFHEKQEELDRQITSLRDINTPAFLYGSLQLYGEVEPELLELAEKLLCTTSPLHEENTRSDGWVDGRELAHLAQMEIGRYRERDNTFNASVVLCDDIASSMMVLKTQVLVAKSAKVRRQRVDPLLHHEIGTHVLTYFNGQAQPFQQMYAGLAGYEQLQEGLGVLAEYLVGGLTVGRIRTLAARVIASRMLTERATFVQTFQRLLEEYRFAPRTAFFITLRVYRAGGVTKDAIYLRGVKDVLGYLSGGLPLERLFIGKIGLAHLRIVDEFRQRGVIEPVRILPRFLGERLVQQRLEDCLNKSVTELMGA